MTRAAVSLALWMLLLSGALTALALLVAQNRAEAQQIDDFLRPPAGCPMPCWQGIRPGITSSLDAVNLLKANPWVTDIYSLQGIVMDSSFVRWRWNGTQPAFVDGTRQALMWLHQGTVYYIEIPLAIPYGDILHVLHAPDAETTDLSPNAPPQTFYEATYFAGTLAVRSTVLCPFNAWNIVSARVDVRILALPNPQTNTPTRPTAPACPTSN